MALHVVSYEPILLIIEFNKMSLATQVDPGGHHFVLRPNYILTSCRHAHIAKMRNSCWPCIM